MLMFRLLSFLEFYISNKFLISNLDSLFSTVEIHENVFVRSFFSFSQLTNSIHIKIIINICEMLMLVILTSLHPVTIAHHVLLVPILSAVLSLAYLYYLCHRRTYHHSQNLLALMDSQ